MLCYRWQVVKPCNQCGWPRNRAENIWCRQPPDNENQFLLLFSWCLCSGKLFGIAALNACSPSPPPYKVVLLSRAPHFFPFSGRGPSSNPAVGRTCWLQFGSSTLLPLGALVSSFVKRGGNCRRAAWGFSAVRCTAGPQARRIRSDGRPWELWWMESIAYTAVGLVSMGSFGDRSHYNSTSYKMDRNHLLKHKTIPYTQHEPR